jgi:uncharacterized protein (DUF1697 family)
MKHVALLRGVNVGGRNLLPMKDLANMFVEAGCKDVRTYIQSGNVIFSAPPTALKGLPGLVTERIAQRFGYRIPVILRNSEQLGRILSGNPFLLAGETQKTLHVYFLADLPDRRAVGELDIDRSPTDSFRVSDREIYLHLPNGMARTKLTNAYFDSKLSTTSTARNWATLLKLFELMQA